MGMMTHGYYILETKEDTKEDTNPYEISCFPMAL